MAWEICSIASLCPAHFDADDGLYWEVPENSPLDCTLNDHCRVSAGSQGLEGYALDSFDLEAFRRSWDAVVEPLIYIHRRTSEADLYFIVNRGDRPLAADCTFRVAGKQPELWNPLTGQHRDLPEFFFAAGRTRVPLVFSPYGSWFVVFRNPASEPRGSVKKNFPTYDKIQTVRIPG